jgi:hypothetical protein
LLQPCKLRILRPVSDAKSRIMLVTWSDESSTTTAIYRHTVTTNRSKEPISWKIRFGTDNNVDLVWNLRMAFVCVVGLESSEYSTSGRRFLAPSEWMSAMEVDVHLMPGSGWKKEILRVEATLSFAPTALKEERQPTFRDNSHLNVFMANGLESCISCIFSNNS